MIKNKTLHIKIIFKILKIFQFPNKFLFHKILENNFKKLFFKIILKK